MSEKQVNVKDRIQKIGDRLNDYKETLTKTFKDMNIEVKDWNFTVEKAGKQYDAEMTFKLRIKPKPTIEPEL